MQGVVYLLSPAQTDTDKYWPVAFLAVVSKKDLSAALTVGDTTSLP